jgi:glycosyltransferase involved in cell wall biosynthesis
MIDSKLKRCVVITSFDANQPGFMDFSYRLNALASEFQLSIVSHSTLTQPELLIADASYHVISTSSGKLGWLRYIVKCARFIHKAKPDLVVLLHSAVAPISLLVRNIPTCLYWNEHPTNLMQLTNQQPFLKRWLTQLMHKLFFLGAKKANTVMPIGEDHQQDLIVHGVASDKICMIYMGVSEHFINQSNVRDSMEVMQLIYIGTVSVSRGRDVMLEAMRALAKDNLNIHLTLVGADSSELNYCEAYIKNNSLAHAITVHGRVTGDQIPSFLSKADAAICIWQPSPWNRFNPPTKLFEYLVAGLPVLANNIRTHTRYIDDWKNGLVFDYNTESLSNAVRKLYEQRQQLPKLKISTTASSHQYLWGNLEPIFMEKLRDLVGVRA